MTRKNVIGATLCLCIFFTAFAFMDNGLAFLNVSGLAVVICGTLGAMFLSHPFEDLMEALRTAKHMYTTTPPSATSIVQCLLELSIKSRCHGLLSLEKSAGKQGVAFLRDGLDLLVDGYSQEEIQEILSMEMAFFKNRRQQSEVVFRNMGRMAPSFGVAGSVIGLIGMLSGLGDTEIILQTIPMALTSTLYGIVFNQFLCAPLAEAVRGRTNTELLNASIIVQGILAIKKEQHPHKLEKRLASLLAPAQRSVTSRDFQAIRQKYIRMVRTHTKDDSEVASGASTVPSWHTLVTRT